MAEMPSAGHHHRDAGLLSRSDDLVVAHRAAGLDHGDDARLDRELRSVGEREERV